MTTTAITGSRGFLGWHTRARSRALHGETPAGIQLGDGYDATQAAGAVDGIDHLIHIAGVNRGTDTEVLDGNVRAAERAVAALRAATQVPRTLTFANSVQVGNGSVYAEGKQRAAEILAAAADDLGIRFRDVLLPNIFGEHGVPFYNSVVATFCHLAARGDALTVAQDKPLTLLHAQKAAAVLLDPEAPADAGPAQGAHVRSVIEIKDTIERFAAIYRAGDIPPLSGSFDVELFNTYRSFAFDSQTPIALVKRTDDRGSLAETVRVMGGQSHTFFSTTKPGVTRGQHHHLRKIERFVVLAGTAKISLRKVLTDEVRTFQVDGENPVAIDMPTLWAHKITNTGDTVLFTQFWANEIFDPEDTDTHPEEV
ncbi:polysaccharide biosynthesis C-terminal domain-containing protein [Sanguibacter inulinus]|uniref:polysaccharide biosynthesis C-terminal domain-containing protein n=1 Tax=Sanguibacter inulinus TaxID=60922 RepID=UPI001C54D4F4|nr:capsular biosynthesis protein [Sanguibacter inulinus]